MGIGLLLSCVSVFLRDVFYIYGIVLTIWNYLTPIFYGIEIIPKNLMPIFKQNPIFIFITSVRTIVLDGRAPSLTMLIMCSVWGIGMFGIGSIIFKKNQDKFIYYV
jgi:ABC-2 type transport system permease protein